MTYIDFTSTNPDSWAYWNSLSEPRTVIDEFNGSLSREETPLSTIE